MTTEQQKQLDTLDRIQDQVFKSYSGRPGCMCGCKGDYKYATKFQTAGGQERSYDVDTDELSGVAVKRMISSMRKRIQAGETLDVNTEGEVGYFFHKTETRYNAIYFFNKNS